MPRLKPFGSSGNYVIQNEMLRIERDLNLSAAGQHFLGVNVNCTAMLTPRICLSVALKPKSGATRHYIRKFF